MSVLSLLGVGLAFAGPALVEVTAAPDAQGGLLAADQAWLRTSDGCVPVRLTQGDEVVVHAPLCSAFGAVCEQRLYAGRSWWSGGGFCDAGDHGWAGMITTSSEPPLVLVQLDDQRALWTRVVNLRVDFERHSAIVAACDAESHAALAPLSDAERWDRHRVRGGERWCDTSTGLVVLQHDAGNLLGVGIDVTRDERPVDCRRSCPPNPDLPRVRSANAELQGRLFAIGSDGVAMFATAALCESTPDAPALALDRGVCAGPAPTP